MRPTGTWALNPVAAVPGCRRKGSRHVVPMPTIRSAKRGQQSRWSLRRGTCWTCVMSLLESVHADGGATIIGSPDSSRTRLLHLGSETRIHGLQVNVLNAGGSST
jgi:hypothetical protein